QHDLAVSDLMAEMRPRSGSYSALLVLKLRQLKLKMYQEQGHHLPHLHVDYGREHHTASYSIDPACRLEGDLAGRYESAVMRFIMGHQQQLLELWSQLQAGSDHHRVLAELQEADT